LAGWRLYQANDMGDSIVITVTSSGVTQPPHQRQPPRRTRQRQLQQQQQQQPTGQWLRATLILCHSILEANATSDFFVAEAFVLDGWSVFDHLEAFVNFFPW